MCEQTNTCPHPAIGECVRCRIGLCSVHIVQCEDCNQVFCRECAREHEKAPQRITRGELENIVRRMA